MVLTRSTPAVVLEAGPAFMSPVASFAHPRGSSWQEHRGDALERLAGMAAGINTHVVAVLAAQDLPDGLIVFLADQVQQSGLDSADGMENQARRGVNYTGMHAAQQAVDRRGVFTDQDG